MAGRGMMQRIEALEREDRQAFTGYAVVTVDRGETLDEAQAKWVSEYGPVGTRQWVVYYLAGARHAA